MLKQNDYQQCSKCLFDNNDYPEIKFDESGVCSVCHIYDDLQARTVKKGQEGKLFLNSQIAAIKLVGQNKKYDCIVGVSGGVDSSYMAYLAKQWGLKPLILHVDNGWNSELAVGNIERLVQTLGFDLYTEVIDWPEMRDIQLAFFRASVLDIDLPFDNIFMAILYKIAVKYKIKYIISGHNTVTEGWMPDTFCHYKLDTINLKAIQKQFGTLRLKHFPMIGPFDEWWFKKVHHIQFVSPLDCIEYNKAEIKQFLISEMGWRDYGGKHYENIFTKFYQGYILPVKFGIDKRKSHLSTLICSGQITKQEALEEIKKPSYDAEELKKDKEFFIKKIGITEEEFEGIMALPIKKHTDFPSYINIFKRLSKIKRAIFK